MKLGEIQRLRDPVWVIILPLGIYHRNAHIFRLPHKRRKIVEKNELEAKQAVARDQVQLKQVAQVQKHSKLEVLSKEQTLRRQFKESRSELRQDIQSLKNPRQEEPTKDAKRDAYMRKRKSTSPRPKRSRDGPDLSG